MRIIEHRRFYSSKKHFFNAGIISLATIAGSVFGFVNNLLLNKIFDINSYGAFMSAYSLVMLLAPIGLFGIPTLWLKLFGKDGADADKWIRPSLHVVSLLSIALVCLISGWGYFGFLHDEKTSGTYIILSWLIPLSSFHTLVTTKNQIEDKFIRYSIYTILPILSRFSLLILLFYVYEQASTQEVALYYVICFVLVLMSMSKDIKELINNLIRINAKPIASERSEVKVITIFKETYSFGYSGILFLAWSQGHIFITKYKFDNSNAAIYSVALLILSALTLVPTNLFSRYLTPKIHYYFFKNKGLLKKYFGKANMLLAIAGVIVGTFLYYSADIIISLLFAKEYAPTSRLLKIFAFTIPLKFIGLNSGTLLTTGSYIIHKNKILSLAVVFNLIATLLMPEKYGIYGLAYLVLVTESFLFLYYVFYTKYVYFKS
jgi:O-antigen/teichoic acid export membrane protein